MEGVFVRILFWLHTVLKSRLIAHQTSLAILCRLVEGQHLSIEQVVNLGENIIALSCQPALKIDKLA